MFRRRGVAQAFRDNQQLQQFVLNDVTATEKVLGTGSYGSVVEVRYRQLVCAGKKLHEILVEAGNDGVDGVVRKYLKECQLMSSLRHPNITLFLGLCYLPGTQLPLLVMERLETSLDDLLEHIPNLPLSLKRSVLEDVASGLLYLHKMQPPVIHRDLTANNVLLTSSLVAKISDMGNSRIVNLRGGQIARTLSKLPGTLVYMPPEALDDRHHYGPSLDVFSFGHLALFALTQKFPGDLLPITFYNPDNLAVIQARTEVERRGQYIALLEAPAPIGVLYPDLVQLVQLVKQCLQNIPDQRPSTDELLATLQRMKVEVEGAYGGPFKLDMVRVRLAKEVKELTHQQENHEAELNRMTREMEEKTREVEEKTREVEEKTREVEEKTREVYEKMRELQTKDEHIATKDREILDKTDQIQQQLNEMEQLRADLQVRETRLREEMEAENRRLREELSRCQDLLHEEERQVPLKLPLQLSWRRGPDMPFEMRGYVQSVVVEGTVYVGGGRADSYSDNTVMTYDISTGKWATLPPYRARGFAVTVINNQLVLVGGEEHDAKINLKVLGVWNSDDKQWTRPYPEMHTARSYCSAVVYKEWLVVTGGLLPGVNLFANLLSVEVMNTISKQWYAGPPTPALWSCMRTAVVGNTCYFMGGLISEFSTYEVYTVSLSALTSWLTSKEPRKKKSPMWSEISGLQLTNSTPLSISGSLLAVGGKNKDRKAVTAIHLYQPDTGKWVKVGDLQTPGRNYTCVLLNPNREILVFGGSRYTKTMDIAKFK